MAATELSARKDQRMTIRSTILSLMEKIAEQQGKTLAPLSDDLPLLETGLDSLGVAILVANLDDALEIDPFAENSDFAFPVTLGDFIRLYENASV